MKLSRREMMRTAGIGAAALAVAPLGRLAAADPAPAAGFTLPKLPYPYDALEPTIDKRTMEIHHDMHHQAYVNNLNAALAAHPDLLKKPVEELLRDPAKLPMAVRQAVINNG